MLRIIVGAIGLSLSLLHSGIASEGGTYLDETPHNTLAWLNLVQMERQLYRACDEPILISFPCRSIELTFTNLERVELRRTFILKVGQGRKPVFEIRDAEGSVRYLTPLSGYPTVLSDEEVASRIREDVKHLFFFDDPRAMNPDWPERTWEAIANRVIRIGMTAEQVVFSWGEPDRRTRHVGAWGVNEQWVYGGTGSRVYVYLDNGIVTGWQD